MLRLLVFVLLVLLIWVLLSAALAWLRATFSSHPTAASRRTSGRPRQAERLVRCAGCGVRVPESRALHLATGTPSLDGTAYCSEACRRQAMRDSA